MCTLELCVYTSSYTIATVHFLVCTSAATQDLVKKKQVDLQVVAIMEITGRRNSF